MAAAITALRIEPAKCTGCKQCELACSWVQTGAFQPARSLIRVHVFDEQASYAPYACVQCDEAWGMHACPVNAIDVDEETGAKIVVVPCHNCFDQLRDLSAEYDLGISVMHFKTIIPHVWDLPDHLKPKED